MNKEQINNTQFWTLLVIIIWPSLTTFGSGIIRESGRDMWISGILALVTTGIFVPILIYLGRKFSGKTIVEYSEKILGTLLGKIIGIILFFYFITAATISIAVYLYHLIGYLLPETPFLVLTVMHLFVVFYMVWNGPEVIARVSIIAFVAALIIYILVFLASITDLRLERILPILDSGLPAVGLASIKIDSFTGQSLLVIAMLLPLLKDQKKALRSSLTGVVVGGFLFIVFFFMELTVMGSHLLSQTWAPAMYFVRSIQITQYLHRFESFLVALWYWSMVTQASLTTYCSTLVLQQTVGLKKYRKWVVTGTCLLIIIFNYLLTYNRVTFVNFLDNRSHYYFVPLQFGLPLLLFILTLFRIPYENKRSKK